MHLVASSPRHLVDLIAEAAAAGARTVVMAEDWHTVWPLIGLHDELTRRDLRGAATLAWTSNNRFGFDRIDFGRLAAAARIVTISRAMKHLMWGYAVNPHVVPNGIPDEVFVPVDPTTRRVSSAEFPDPELQALLNELSPLVDERRGPPASTGPIIDIEFLIDGTIHRYASTITTLRTTADVSLQESASSCSTPTRTDRRTCSSRPDSVRREITC